MIIECGHCGAPLDVKTNDRTTKCNYCNTPNQVKAQRTIAFETPVGWQPPPQWQPPQQFAAHAHQVLTYHKTKSAVGLVVTIVVVSVLVTVGGIVASVVSTVATTASEISKVNQQVDDATKGANDAIAQALARASAAQEEAFGKIPEAAKGQPSLSPLTSAGVRQVLAVYKEASGAQVLHMKRLTLHETHSSAEIQSPKNPNHVDEYDYHSGRVQGPEPVRLMGNEKTNLAPHLFDPEQTALSNLDALKTVAMGQLAYEEAKITHVIVDRDRGKTVIRIYGGNKRDSGYVAFDDKGKVSRVAR
jgi:hypothetical protein